MNCFLYPVRHISHSRRPTTRLRIRNPIWSLIRPEQCLRVNTGRKTVRRLKIVRQSRLMNCHSQDMAENCRLCKECDVTEQSPQGWVSKRHIKLRGETGATGYPVSLVPCSNSWWAAHRSCIPATPTQRLFIGVQLIIRTVLSRYADKSALLRQVMRLWRACRLSPA